MSQTWSPGRRLQVVMDRVATRVVARRRGGLVWAACLLGALWSSTGCGSGDGGASGLIRLANENNYRSTANLSLPTVETAPASDLDICWTGTTADLQCHAVVPETDIDTVGLLRLRNLTQSQIEAQLVSDTLAQSSVDGYVQYFTDHAATCMKLSQFSFFGTASDIASLYVESAVETYMLVFAKGLKPGGDSQAMIFLKPTAASTTTRVDAPSGCGLLEFSADLTTLTKVPVSANGPWTIDWGDVTTNGQGDPVGHANVDQLLVGFYQGLTLADLQARFFDLELLATSLWELPVKAGHAAELGQAVERTSGTAFSGFGRRDGVWVLALLCTTCQNPAPVVLTLLEPGPEAP